MGKRGQRCTVCDHRERAAIDLAVCRGVTPRALAVRYRVGLHSLYRHAKNHLTAPMRAALIAGPSLEGVDLDKLRENESQSLLMHLVALRNRLFSALDVAEESGDAHMTSRVAGQLHKNFELTGELLGQLGMTGGTTINVGNLLIAPAYVELRISLVKALRPFPEAAQAVATVLHTIEHKAAAAITSQSRELAHD